MTRQAGRIDRGQFRALLRLSLGQMLRTGISPTTSARVRPLPSLIINMGILGLIFCMNARSSSPADYFRILFAACLGLVIMSIDPETGEMRERRMDVLGSRPISNATHYAVGVAGRIVVLFMTTLSFSLLPLIVAVAYLGVSVPMALLQAVMLLIQAAVFGVAWLHAYGVGLRFAGPEQLRRLNQLGGLCLIFMITIGSMGLPHALPEMPARLASGLSTIAGALATALPSTWFAEAFHAPDGLTGVLRIAGLILLLAFAFVVPWTGDLERHQRRVDEALALAFERSASRPEKRRRGFSLRLLGVLGGILDSRSRAVAEAILLHAERDEGARMRTMMQLGLGGIFLALALLSGNPAIAEWLLLYLCLNGVVEGVEAARRSPDGAAGWVFFSTTVPRRCLIAGVQASVLLRAALLPLCMLAIILIWGTPGWAGVACLLGVLAGLKLISAAFLMVRPGMPLSDNGPALSQFVGLGFAAIGGAAALIAVNTMRAALASGAAGVVLAGGLLAVIVLLTVLVERVAASRLELVEHAA